MRTSSATAAAAALLLGTTATLSCTAQPPKARFQAPALPALSAQVTAVPQDKLGDSHRPGCPVPAERLRLIRMNHWGFDGQIHRGELIVHRNAVRPLIHAFGKAFEARFPIRRMRVMAEYGGDDGRAMAEDNTSGFNCRRVTGDARQLSQHAWGDAVDINPVENPYVDRQGVVHPAEGRAYLTRTPDRPGTIVAGDAVTTAFREIGWHWGGRWTNPDYQHFSANGD
ncbi:M15 family metallopeptidase [Streptomyces venezuelae]|uniref:M15 family metallopeptidase n=1 Tax=Streptomyces venezuelae TaxID=54571 RepID=UPI001CC262BA|nr:M15 family metallopeptidase [Streptomyces venezuelae]